MPTVGSYPLEFKGLNLQEIAERLIGPLGIALEFVGIPGPVFERVKAPPGQTISQTLWDLAKQRGFIMNDTPEGKLRFSRVEAAGAPVARFEEGVQPLISVRPELNARQQYSHVTGLAPVTTGAKGARHTVVNPHVNGALRPYTSVIPDLESSELKAAVEALAGRMFSSTVRYQITLNAWNTDSGELWAPGQIVELNAPSARVNQFYAFLIDAVVLSATPAGRRAELTLVLPGVYAGLIPEAMPWQN